MKKSLMFFLVLLCVLPLFAVRRTRVDTSGNTTYKIIWNDAYVGGPDNTNRAQELEQTSAGLGGWTRVRISHYLCNNGTEFVIALYTDDNAGFYDYKYFLDAKGYADGLWEDVGGVWSYGFQYNDALNAFRRLESMCEISIQ